MQMFDEDQEFERVDLSGEGPTAHPDLPDLREMLKEYIDRAAQARDSIVKLRESKQRQQARIQELEQELAAMVQGRRDEQLVTESYLHGVFDTIAHVIQTARRD